MTTLKPTPRGQATNRARGRDLRVLLDHFDTLAETSRHVLGKSAHHFASAGEIYSIPRYLWSGPQGGGETFRLGLFATLNGDESEGAEALQQLTRALEANPDIARGYALFLYPVCNPTGYEDNTRLSRAGHALNRLFWTESAAPEVRFLESEIWMHAFHGIINLRSDAGSEGIYGFSSSAVHSEALLEPALQAAEVFVPRNRERQSAGVPSRRGLVYAHIYNRNEGGLMAVPGLEQPPFEITLAAPRNAVSSVKIPALVAALTSVLSSFRQLQAIGQNI